MPSEREKMLAGELYDPLDPELVRDLKLFGKQGSRMAWREGISEQVLYSQSGTGSGPDALPSKICES